MRPAIGDDTVKLRPNLKYRPIEDVERLERYHPGGYHPIRIGDFLNDRYTIVHKLGFGAFSTTWLAKDQNAARYVAIKIGIADSDSRESDILHLLANVDQGHQKKHPGRAIIPLIRDKFTVNGPNGRHRAIVTTPARMSLAEAKDASYTRLFRPNTARAIVAQLVLGVAYLHSLGIVHADLHPGNVLLRLPKDIENLTPDQIYERYGQPKHEPVMRLDSQPLPVGVPTHGIVPVWLGAKSESIPLSEARIILTDFGESFLPSATPRFYSSTPDLLVPPEVRFSPQEPLSFSADIWTLACTIWTILGQRPLFEAFNPSDDWMTKEHVEVLGKLPPEWWERWEARREWFTEQGVRDHGAVGRSWEERFEYCVQEPRRECKMKEVGDDEKTVLFAVLKSMMAFRPQERPTAEEILESAWMRSWCLPELEKMEDDHTQE